MRDYYHVDDSGARTPVAQMDTSDIRDCLENGFSILNDGCGETAEDVIERLRIELLIRALGLNTERVT